MHLQAAQKAKKALQRLSWLDGKEDNQTGSVSPSVPSPCPAGHKADVRGHAHHPPEAAEQSIQLPSSPAPRAKMPAKRGRKQAGPAKNAKVEKPVRKPRKGRQAGKIKNAAKGKSTGSALLHLTLLTAIASSSLLYHASHIRHYTR